MTSSKHEGYKLKELSRHRAVLITSPIAVLNLGPLDSAVVDNPTTAPARILIRHNPTTSSAVD